MKIISSLGMAILLLALLCPAPAAAGTAEWSAEIIPNTTNTILGPAGIDIRDIAVAGSGGTIYAVAGDSIAGNLVYKSTDTGASWSEISTNIAPDLVAAAPDDVNFIAIASTATAQVRVTLDGGTTWYNLGVPQASGSTATAIYDLAISKADDGLHYIAAAGKAAGGGDIWYYDAGAAASAWRRTSSLPGFDAASEARAVAFSPNLPEDTAMVAVTVASGAAVKAQILNISSGRWNTDFSTYPVTLASAGSITGLNSASISLAPDYLASESARRVAFIGLAVSGNNAYSGIYRLNNVTKTGLKLGTGIHSIAYNGSSIVAGQYDGNNVYRSGNPLASTPTVSSTYAYKTPGGGNKVVVAWAGSKVVAGTSGDESAFAVSENTGAAFSDVSLIDTAITNIRDTAVAADGRKAYLVTDDGTNLSLWRKASAWRRVLGGLGAADSLVRLGPDEAVYLAKKNTATIYHNKEGGDAVWYALQCPVNIQDMAVESDGVVYALNGAGRVARTGNAGYNWSAVLSTGLSSGATIVSAGTDNVLVGSQNGYVAYSTDGNTNWTMIEDVTESGAGNVQVIADKNFATNRIIYAASDTAGQNIRKWQIGSSDEWTDIFRNTISGGIYGLAMDDTTLYALEFNPTSGQSRLWQCLLPTTATYISESWSSSATTAQTDTSDAEVHLNAAPRALKVSSGKLWAVKTNGTEKLYSFTYVLISITASGPSADVLVPVNPITGIAGDVGFGWTRTSSATAYELEIALDEDFEVIIATVTVASDDESVYVMVGPNMAGNARVNFMPGQTYHWRVRTTLPLFGRYSEASSFTISPITALVPQPLAPKNGGTGISRTPSFSWQPLSGATGYRFVLDDDVAMDSPLIDTTVTGPVFTVTEDLEYGGTYFWKVKPLEPLGNDWSSIWNFTVMKEASEAAAPVIIVPPTSSASPPVIDAPPPTTVTLPPVTPPDIPNYLPFVIALAAGLLLAVLFLIIKLTVKKPLRAIEGLSGRLGALREGLACYLRQLKVLRPRAATAIPAAGGGEAGQSLSFAIGSFLWMTGGEKDEGASLLSAEEEQAMGKKLASRVEKLAGGGLLYKDFPEDAASFLDIWSRYGSREATDRYLSRSFQSKPENAIAFLKCYLGDAGEAGFDHDMYQAVAAVVNPESVYGTLAGLSGDEPVPDDPEEIPLARILAARFSYQHQLATAGEGKEPRPTQSGLARSSTGQPRPY